MENLPIRLVLFVSFIFSITACNPGQSSSDSTSSDPVYAVKGSVFDGPVYSSLVKAYDEQDQLLGQTRTDSGGHFTFSELSASPVYLTAEGGQDLGPDSAMDTFDDSAVEVVMTANVSTAEESNITPLTTVQRLIPATTSLKKGVGESEQREAAMIIAAVKILMAAGLTSEQAFQSIGDSIPDTSGAFSFDQSFTVKSESTASTGQSLHPSIVSAANTAFKMPDLDLGEEADFLTYQLQASAMISGAIAEYVSESYTTEIPWFGGLTGETSLLNLAKDLQFNSASNLSMPTMQSCITELHEKIKSGEIDPSISLNRGTISLENHPPQVVVSTDRFATVGGEVVIDASLSFDVDGNPLSFEWTILSKPGTSEAVLIDSNQAVVSFTPDTMGTYKLRLAVRDGITRAEKEIMVTAKHGVVKSQWQKILSSAPWVARTGHRAEAFKNQVWMLGGTDETGSPLKEIWTSTGSTNWNRVVPPWSARSYLGSTIFNHQLWIMGGVDRYSNYNDVWRSVDGVQWTQMASAAQWSARSGHTAVASPDKLWILGGFDGSLKNDVWYSNDGVSWQLATNNASWSPRKYHTSLYYKDKIWVIGGMDDEGKALNDVWYSSDGNTWNEYKPVGGFPPRYLHSMVIHNGKMTITGGMENTGEPLEHTISSFDGRRWRLSLAKGERPKRYNHAAVSFDQQLWLLGGEDNVSIYNDVWVFRAGVIPSLSVDAGEYQTVLVGNSVTLGGNDDPTSDSDLSYQWTLTAKPVNSQAILYDATTPNPFFTPDLAGDYRVLLTVTDNRGWSASDQVDISAVYMLNGHWTYSGGIDPLAAGNPAYTFKLHSENIVRIDLMADSLNSALILMDDTGETITLDNDLTTSDSSIYQTLVPGTYIIIPATLYKNAVGDFQLNLGGEDIEKIDVPISRSNGMTLAGWNGLGDSMTGTLTIQKAYYESDLLNYLLYWGENKTNKLPGSSLIGYVNKTGLDQTYQLTDVNIPTDAAYLLLYSGNERGELALPVSLRIGGSLFPKQAAAGKNHTCALLSDHTLKCWGGGSKGQLGSGFLVDVGPVVDVKNLNSVQQLDAGSEYNCALSADGTIACWGNGNDGRLGNGSQLDEVLPKMIDSLAGVTQVATGSYHACALLDIDQVWCWGVGYDGQLGNGDDQTSMVPTRVLNLSDIKEITGGGFHTCALMNDGTVSCWGSGGDGALGNGTNINYNIPVQVADITAAIQITAGNNHTCAVIENGTVQCWGSGLYGQLGNGNTISSNIPVTVTNISNAKEADAGWGHSCALLQTGQIKCWGYGQYGQLGNGGTISSSVPVLTSEISNAMHLSTGNLHTCAVQADGVMKCWGFGSSGQLGDGITISLPVPQPVPGL